MAGDVVPYAANAQPARQAHMLPQSLADASRIAEYIAASGLFGCKTKEQAFSLMLLADAEGLHPAAAARDYHIIEGRPSLKADAMLARYMTAGGRIEWTCRTDEKVAAKFTHPASGTVEIEWTIERARKITRYNRKKEKNEALTDNQNWKNYPRQMLSARVISEGVRMSFPAIVAGVYTPEEVQDFDEPAASVSRPAAAPSPQPLAVEVEHTEAGAAVSDAAAPASSSNVPGGVKSVKDFAQEEALTQKDYSTEPEWEELLSEMESHATREDVTAWWKSKRELKQSKPHMMRAFSHFALTPYWESLSETVVWDEAEAGARG